MDNKQQIVKYVFRTTNNGVMWWPVAKYGKLQGQECP